MTGSLEEILMKGKRHSPEAIVRVLREAEQNEQPLAEFCRAQGISQETYLPLAAVRRGGCAGGQAAAGVEQREQPAQAVAG